MAKPRAELPAADALRALADAEGRIAIRVTPGAREEALDLTDGKLSAKVRAAPEGGRANEAVRSLLAGALGVAPSRLELLRGATSREKLFWLVDR